MKYRDNTGEYAFLGLLLLGIGALCAAGLLEMLGLSIQTLFK